MDSGLYINGGKGVPGRSLNGPYQDYLWRVEVTVANGPLLTDSEGCIKARLDDENGYPSGDLISGPVFLNMIPSAPEPESYALMLAGFGLLLGAVARRRQGKQGTAADQPRLPTNGRAQAEPL